MVGDPVIQFYIPREAADAVNVSGFRALVREAGIADDRFGSSDFKTRHMGTRITCSMDAARFLYRALEVKATLAVKTEADERRRAACLAGMRAVAESVARGPHTQP
jgi:hypothetical protein